MATFTDTPFVRWWTFIGMFVILIYVITAWVYWGKLKPEAGKPAPTVSASAMSSMQMFSFVVLILFVLPLTIIWMIGAFSNPKTRQTLAQRLIEEPI